MVKIHRIIPKIELKNLCSMFGSIRTLIVILYLFANSTKADAQKLIFENIGVRSGLPSTEVYNLFQDSRGYLWIFTEYGVVKYNGSSYVPVCKNLPLKESAIYGVTASNNGNMYIVNSVGNIYRVHDDSAFKLLGINSSVKKKLKEGGAVIYDLFLDNQNGIYFSSFYETFYASANSYYVKGLKKEKVTPTKARKIYPIHSLNKRNSAKSHDVLIKMIDGNRKRVFNWYKGNTVWTRIIARSARGNEYVTTENRLESCNAKGEHKILEFPTFVVNMEVDKKGHIWVSLLGGGLREFDSQLNEVDRYFDKIIISDILFDNQGGMWVSTIGKGVFHCKDINQKSYKNIPGMKDNYISMLRVENHKLFIGTYTGNLFRIEKDELDKIEIHSDSHVVTDVLYVNNSYLLTTSNELIYADQDFKLRKILNGACYALSTVDENTILVVSANSIAKCKLSPVSFERFVFMLPRARSVSKRFGNEYFVVTKAMGVFRVKNWKGDFLNYLSPLKDKDINRTVSENERNIWFCSKGNGIYCLDSKNRVHHYTHLPTPIVNDICFTKDNYTVIATNKGVFTAHRDSMNSISAWKLILNEESIRLAEFDRKLFIGTTRGLTSMDCAQLIPKKKYRFHLNSIFSRGKKLRIRKELIFNYNQNDLYLNYDLLNYHSDDHQLEYKLEGPTQLNDVVSGTRLHLQNLTPGEYILYVNPLMNNTKTSDLLLVTKFTIRPAFWQTWTFRVVVLVMVLSTILLVFWSINNRRNKKAQEVNQIENLLTEYRLTALKSQVNPHFMSNSLVAIQRLILEKETDKAHQYIAKFSLLLRSLLEYSSRSSATIKNELKMIELYVELEQLRFSHHFLFEIHIDEEINPDNTYMPALITQPFVENAIWHGLLPLEGKRQPKLELSVTEYENGIVISVKDNGVGREFNKEKKKHGEFESRGTSLIVQRLENLNRLYNSKEGRVDFVDLRDEDGKPAGTEVKIVLPDEILIQLYERRNS